MVFRNPFEFLHCSDFCLEGILTLKSLQEAAVELCRVLQERHYYTDTAAFSVRCNVCGKVSIGEKGATEHAAATGHYDFGGAA